jgi:Flp pilus assembly pilin Flp
MRAHPEPVASRPAALGELLSRTLHKLARDARGAVMTEYVVLVGVVGLAVVGALVAIGPELVEGYAHARSVIAAPFP